MGTNYYLNNKACPTCGHEKEGKHIGKSSYGWAFALHIYPDEEIHHLNHWISLWSAPGALIHNEYGDPISYKEMERIVTQRTNAYRRSTIDGTHCIGHGAGSWDLILGEFS